MTNLISRGPHYPTISAALAAAAPGDTLAARAVTLNIELTISKSITIRGGFNPTFSASIGLSTITNALNSRIIDVTRLATRVILDRLHLTNGFDISSGGGTYVRSAATCEVSNTEITGCSATLVAASTPLIMAPLSSSQTPSFASTGPPLAVGCAASLALASI
ncbi:MAG: hypothetical protein N2595_00960 [bacterium]|nr:hypothetical protein [bacterium]